MLIECASEYGIRMEAVRFDIPFCLRSPAPSAIIHLFLVIWPSPPHPSRVRIRRRLFLSSPNWATRATARLLRRHCMRIENDPTSVLFSELRVRLLPCLLCTYRHGAYVVPIIHYKILFAYAMSREIARTFARCLRINTTQRSFCRNNRNIFCEKM